MNRMRFLTPTIQGGLDYAAAAVAVVLTDPVPESVRAAGAKSAAQIIQ